MIYDKLQVSTTATKGENAMEGKMIAVLGWILFFLSAVFWGVAEGYFLKRGGSTFWTAFAIIQVAASVYLLGLWMSPGNLGVIALFWDVIAFFSGVISYSMSDLGKVLKIWDLRVLLAWVLLFSGAVLWMAAWNLFDKISGAR